MGAKKKVQYFQVLRDLASASKLAHVMLLVLVLIPTNPVKKGSLPRIEAVQHLDGKETDKLFKIYSVVKSHRMDLREDSAWAISETILEESTKHSLDPMLVLAIISVESGFQLEAVSTRGARGLMQILPFVASALVHEAGLTSESRDLDPEFLDDPVMNIKLGVFYLNNLKKSFRDLRLTLTAYNWGPTEIKNRLEGDEPVPLEYATRVLSTYNQYRKGGGTKPPVPGNN